MTYRPIVLAALLAMATATAASADVVISTDPTSNMSCSGGVCAPTAAYAVLNVTDLENLLASGDVSVVTTNGSVQANNIDLHAVCTWNSANGLTLDALYTIKLGRPVHVQNVASLTIVTKNGDLQFGQRAHITFANVSSKLSINGVLYQLENSVASLATVIAANSSGNFALANDYDASADGTYSSSPIQTTFYGTLEGLGNKISHLSINSSDHNVGLFSEIDQGTVANLRLDHVHVGGAGTLVGGLAGAGGNLIADSVSGSVKSTAKSDVGGLAGVGSDVISSHSSARVIASYAYGAGSLVGENGFITDSYATGNVVGGACTGGLAGVGSDIKDSFATGTVRAKSSSTGVAVGGLVGCEDGTISNSYATGEAFGKVQSGNYALVGGLVGSVIGTISFSYSTGRVSGSSGSYLGGLCGYVQYGSKDFAFTYWDTDTSGITNASQGCGNADWPGITGLTSDQLQSGLPTGFDPSTWTETKLINNGFPYLIANPPPQ